MSDKRIDVVADWSGVRVGTLTVSLARGKEIFAFEYDGDWLASRPRALDPSLQLYAGRQYPAKGRETFGVFLDSAPDRWGRVLMTRREAYDARSEGRAERRLLESDYLLGVHDGHRMGGLRFRVDGRFLDDRTELASPPWTSLRELEHASLQLERDGAESAKAYGKWLRMLIAPGGSLGGARPKASIRDEVEALWIAKFPSRNDDEDVGAWEMVVHELAQRAGVVVSEARLQRFGSKHRTFLSKRFDRSTGGRRIHFASAMTVLGHVDGAAAAEGASYLEIADWLMRYGANAAADLEQLWRRIVFSMCVSNTDDHLRNHGFLLRDTGWVLSPAYDINANRFGDGLKLNVSLTDNAQDLDLAMEVARSYRVKAKQAKSVVTEVKEAVSEWREIATKYELPKASQERMASAFRL